MFIGNISCTQQQDLFWPYKETCEENLLASTAWFNFNTFWPVHNAHFDERKGKRLFPNHSERFYELLLNRRSKRLSLHEIGVIPRSSHRPNDTRYGGTRRIWDRSEIRPFSPVYTRICPVRGSQIPWFSCVYTAETDEFQTGPKFVRYRDGVLCEKS